MRALAIVHQPDAGPGVFAETITVAGARLEVWEPPSGRAPEDPGRYGAVLTFGGAMHPDQDHLHTWMGVERDLLAELVAAGVPTLAVCLGAQLLAGAGGGEAQRAPRPEIGWYPVQLTAAGVSDPVLGPLAPGFEACEWHSYECSLPPDATALAHSETCLQAYRIGESAWGIQFHAEVSAPGFDAWIDDYRSDEDAVAMGLDPGRLRREAQGKIAAWNDLGRGLCARFLAVAAARVG